MRAATLALALLGAALVAPADALTIGVSAPTSGPDSVFGDQIQRGVAQAAADVNAAGGILGEGVRVRVADDGANPTTGLLVARAFAQDKVQVVVGPFGSAVAGPASAVYAEAGVLELLPAAIATRLTAQGFSTLFRLCAREDAQAPVAVRYVARHFSRVAIVHDRTDAGTSLAGAFRKELQLGGGAKEVFYGSLAKGTDNVAALVARIKASGAQVLFWSGGPSEAGLLARQIKETGARIAIIGGFALASDEFSSTAGAAADGTLVVFPRDPATRPAAVTLLRRLQARGQSPDGSYFYAYAAVQLVAQAASAAHSTEPRALAASLHGGGPFKTVLGDLAFGPNGDLITPDLTVYVWHRGASGRMAIDGEAS